MQNLAQYLSTTVLALVLTINMQPSNAQGLAYGTGAASCQKIYDANRKQELERSDMQWAVGYLSALSETEPSGSSFVSKLRSLEMKELKASLESFCVRFPLKSFREAVLDSYAQLSGRRN